MTCKAPNRHWKPVNIQAFNGASKAGGMIVVRYLGARKMEDRRMKKNRTCRVINHETRKTTKVISTVIVGRPKYRNIFASCIDMLRFYLALKICSASQSTPCTYREDNIDKVHKAMNHASNAGEIKAIAPRNQPNRYEMVKYHLPEILSSSFKFED